MVCDDQDDEELESIFEDVRPLTTSISTGQEYIMRPRIDNDVPVYGPTHKVPPLM